jgi:NRPS condensation-like uncharacterized protein
MRSLHTGRQTTRRFPFLGIDKLIYAIDGVSKFMLHCILEIEGHLDQQYLSETIDYALAKLPILKSIANFRSFASYWQVVEDLTPYSIFTVRDLSHEGDVERTVKDIIAAYINSYIDIIHTPPTRFLLIRLPEERSVFIVKVHHCAVDPMAVLHLIEDVQDAYATLFNGEPLPPMGEMAVRSRRLQEDLKRYRGVRAVADYIETITTGIESRPSP